MQKRDPEQWRALFAEQAASGMSQSAFCKVNKLCPKYFSLRKCQERGQVLPLAFCALEQA